MAMAPEQGALLGAGAGPSHIHGVPSALAPNVSWKGDFKTVSNLTSSARLSVSTDGDSAVRCPCSDSTEFSLMRNFYGSFCLPGRVVKVTARGRRGDIARVSESMRSALREAYGDGRQFFWAAMAGSAAEAFDRLVREKMKGRRPAFVGEIGGTVDMLCSVEGDWTTGSDVCANGGMRMSIA